ncbi:hypothetical protein DE146DRAFT_424871 [Phaeosphaeria sp. MPI-PUGE-AT-0046c]|nr:hypothetical protein DE146DRAFT_424871 [Phaeosphaeria sp. MPI-PUGE-AT-0046c]
MRCSTWYTGPSVQLNASRYVSVTGECLSADQKASTSPRLIFTTERSALGHNYRPLRLWLCGSKPYIASITGLAPGQQFATNCLTIRRSLRAGLHKVIQGYCDFLVVDSHTRLSSFRAALPLPFDNGDYQTMNNAMHAKISPEHFVISLTQTSSPQRLSVWSGSFEFLGCTPTAHRRQSCGENQRCQVTTRAIKEELDFSLTFEKTHPNLESRVLTMSFASTIMPKLNLAAMHWPWWGRNGSVSTTRYCQAVSSPRCWRRQNWHETLKNPDANEKHVHESTG